MPLRNPHPWKVESNVRNQTWSNVLFFLNWKTRQAENKTRPIAAASIKVHLMTSTSLFKRSSLERHLDSMPRMNPPPSLKGRKGPLESKSKKIPNRKWNRRRRGETGWSRTPSEEAYRSKNCKFSSMTSADVIYWVLVLVFPRFFESHCSIHGIWDVAFLAMGKGIVFYTYESPRKDLSLDLEPYPYKQTACIKDCWKRDC